MTEMTLDRHIEITPEISGGRPRIAGRRITVENIVIWYERMGMSADEIASEYDLPLSAIYAALAYYFDHREAIEKDMGIGDAFVNTLRDSSPSKVAQKLK